jgi:hypothetical protein
MKRGIAFLQVVALVLGVGFSHNGHCQSVNVNEIIKVMNEANGRIEADLSLLLQRCANQATRTAALQGEQKNRAKDAAALNVQLAGLKVALDSRQKISVTAQSLLSALDADIATLKTRIANINKISDQEAAFLSQIKNASADVEKINKQILDANQAFEDWKKKDGNETTLLRALLASLNGSKLSDVQVKALAVLSNYDKTINDFTKLLNDSKAKIDAATLALASLQAGEKKSLAELTASLDSKNAARPAALKAVTAAQADVAQTTATIRGIEAKTAILSRIVIPETNKICAKLKS